MFFPEQLAVGDADSRDVPGAVGNIGHATEHCRPRAFMPSTSVCLPKTEWPSSLGTSIPITKSGRFSVASPNPGLSLPGLSSESSSRVGISEEVRGSPSHKFTVALECRHSKAMAFRLLFASATGFARRPSRRRGPQSIGRWPPYPAREKTRASAARSATGFEP